MSEMTPENLKRFWDDQDVKDLIVDIHESIVSDWETATSKEKREEYHAEVRCLRRLVGRFKAKCEHVGLPDTRKLRT